MAWYLKMDVFKGIIPVEKKLFIIHLREKCAKHKK